MDLKSTKLKRELSRNGNRKDTQVGLVEAKEALFLILQTQQEVEGLRCKEALWEKASIFDLCRAYF